jgi:gluconolactonase
MKSKTALLVVLYAVCSLIAFGQGQAPQGPPTETVTPNIPGVVAAGTRVQVIKDGFEGTEGPVATADGSALFTNANRIMKIDKDNNVSVFLENTNGANGLAFDSKGRLIAVLTAPGKTGIAVLYPKGSEAVLVDRVEGKPFGRPNDLVVDKKGGVYFSDPGPNAQQIAAGLTASKPVVYYLPPGGKSIKIADGIERPNGIQLSPDEKTLYVNNTNGEYLLAFDIQPDGNVRNRRNFAKYEGVTRTEAGVVSGADGLAVDNDGRVYVATAIGVQVFSPKGQHLGTIPLSRAPQNLAFAGPDKKTLYVVGRGVAFKVQTQTQGVKGRAK